MLVRVYRNLHKSTYSIVDWRKGSKTKGRVIEHADTLTLEKCTFIVRPSGREHVRNGGHKVVHAYVQGEWAGPIPPQELAWDPAPDSVVKVQYNPRKGDEGFNVQGQVVTNAPWVWLDAKGAWAPTDVIPAPAAIESPFEPEIEA